MIRARIIFHYSQSNSLKKQARSLGSGFHLLTNQTVLPAQMQIFVCPEGNFLFIFEYYSNRKKTQVNTTNQRGDFSVFSVKI